MGLKCDKTYSDAELRNLQDALYVLNGKWKLYILRSLGQGNIRFKDIKDSMPAITPRMLSKELRELEANHVIARIHHQEDYPSWTAYEFTEYSRGLAPMMDSLISWAESHRRELFVP